MKKLEREAELMQQAADRMAQAVANMKGWMAGAIFVAGAAGAVIGLIFRVMGH